MPWPPSFGRAGVRESAAAGWSAVALAAVALLAYGTTLHPSIAGGDSGELIAAAAVGGVPHPPGYPLWVLLTAPFTWLPIMSVAWWANFATAVFGASAVAMLGWCVVRVTGRWWAGIAAGGIFAFSPTVWLYATSAEVYSLNNFLLSIELALFIAVERNPGRGLVYAGAFVFGLGISNHHTSVFFNGVLLAAMVWRTRDSWREARSILLMTGCVGLGLLPYLYLPIASMRGAPIVWGDATNVQGFTGHLLRRDYGTFQLASVTSDPPMTLLTQIGYYGRDLAEQTSWVGIVLALWGVVFAVRRPETRFIGVVTLFAYTTYLLVFHSLANLPLDQPLTHGVVARFWQAPNLLIALWIGLGVAAPIRLFGKFRAPAALLLATTLAVMHAPSANHRDNLIVHDFGAAILRAAPPGALLLTRGDLITNATRYLHTIEGMRPDLRILDIEMLTFPWMTDQVAHQMPEIVLPGTHYGVDVEGAYLMSHLIEANIPSRPVLVCGDWKPGDPSPEIEYRRLPLGLCDRLVPVSTEVDVEGWRQESEAAVPTFRNDMRPIPPVDSWEYAAWNDFWESGHRRAFALLLFAIERSDDPGLLRSAAEELDRLIASHPLPSPAHYKNLGIARARLATTDPASAPLAVEAFSHYLRIAPPDDPELGAIAQTVRQLREASPSR